MLRTAPPMLAVLVVLVITHAALAATTSVGTCLPQLKSFSTIQAAVSAASPGGTVAVCPGVYPEQVTVGVPLTLRGVASANQGAAVISVPASGLAPNDGVYGDPVALILVKDNTGVVAISDMMVDGGSVTCPAAGSLFGIDLGAANSATITNSVVRNIGTGLCPATAIAAGQDSSLSVKNDSLHDFWFGISANLANTVTIVSNTISRGVIGIGAGSLTGSLTISGNTLVEIGNNCAVANCQFVAIDIGSNHISGTTISSNIIRGGTAGVQGVGVLVVQSENVKIAGNKVNGTYEGITLSNASTAVVENNTIVETTTALIVNDNGSPGGNVVVHNTLNEASCGVLLTPASTADTIAPNTLLNVVTMTCN